jgi:hypothetical protein
MVGRSRVRFHVRVVWLGFWSVLLGGVVLYVTSRALSVAASASATAGTSTEVASTPAEPWLQGLLHEGLRGALHVGAASVGVGLAFAVAGAWLLRATVRGAVR